MIRFWYMKIMVSSLFLGFCFVVLTSFNNASQAVLTVEVTGIKTKKGKVYVALFRKKDDFPTVQAKFKGLLVPADGTTVQARFSDIPADTYAIACFHDENDNGKLDKNALGVPTEIYGFSNDARATFSAPSFESASFTLKEARKMSIRLK